MAQEVSSRISGDTAAGTRFSLYASRTGEPVETVVLIHGVGMNHSVWVRQIDALTARFQVLAYDMLGHGESVLPSANPTLADYAVQLAALLEHLRISRTHVVGHSMGALVALEFALTNPARTLSVAALNAVYDRTPAQRSAVMKRAMTLHEIPAEAGKDAHKNAIAGADATIARWFGEPVPAHLIQAAQDLRSLLTNVNSVGYARTYRLFASSDDAHIGRLGELCAPALFLTGEFDPNSSPAMSKAMAAATRNGQAEVISGARHMMNVTDPSPVNERLLGFLTKAAAPTTRVQTMRDTHNGERHD
ncbi:alpha/beta fold hydrolase [Caballeronia sp. DA-9]|uniref:alpha/beta fold hydrolase n=1 Tax=Caballeronia sp. DA-9 TaxID=3436237 RepID=UPI003F67C92F